MYDLVSIGSLTVDLYFQSEHLTAKQGRFELVQGGKYFTEHFHESLGGGATNVAIGTRRLGLNVSLKTTIGDSGFRTLVEEKLQNEHISYLYSHFEKNFQNISCILLSSKGEKTVINYRTPHQHIFSSEKEKIALLRTQAVYVGNLSDVSLTEKIEILHWFKKHEKLVILNVGGEDCRRSREQLHELLQYADILIVNGHEFADIIKKPFESINFNMNQYGHLGLFNIKALIVTLDKHGSHGYMVDGQYYQVAIEPPVIIDSTGAGDAYTAGFIASYLKKGIISDAMEHGAQYAAKTLSKIGAT